MTRELVVIELASVRVRFTGKLVARDRIEGTWTQGVEMPLALFRGDAGLTAPPMQPPPLTQARLDALREHGGMPALAVAAAGKGSSPQSWVTGERALGSAKAATTQDQWHLGSVTKSMTATLIAKLAEGGAVSWNDTVGDVLGTVAPNMLDAYKRLTLRHLCSQRTGLAANLPSNALMSFPDESTDVREDRRAFARLALAQPPVGPWQTTFVYSNSNFVVAGAMLEAKLARSWEQLIQEHLFAPLRLASAGMGAPGTAGAITQPVGHFAPTNGGALTPMRVGERFADNPAVLGPAGRVHMSLEHVLTYLAAHRDGSAFLQAESWRLLHTPPFGGNYAMGWYVRADGGLSHPGTNLRWYAEVFVAGARDVATVGATNAASPQAATSVEQAMVGAYQSVKTR